MPWARFDDRYPSHRKVRPLSDAAFRLDVSAVCWSNENLTDGYIRTDELDLVADIRARVTNMKVAEELVLRGRWDKTEGGWQIHDFLVYNPSREQVLAERSKAAERQRRAREAAKSKRDAARDRALDIELGHSVSHADSHSSSHGVTPPVTSPVSHGGSSVPPTRTRPVPDPTRAPSSGSEGDQDQPDVTREPPIGLGRRTFTDEPPF